MKQEHIDIWDDDDGYYDDDILIEWCEGHKKRNAQKASLKEELLPIAWHPDPVMDWCMAEDEKGFIFKNYLIPLPGLKVSNKYARYMLDKRDF